MFLFFLARLVKQPSVLVLTLVGFILNSLPSKAQIVSDDTVGSQISQTENQQIVTGGMQVGTNLFHSFSEFSVPTGTEVYFNNDLSVDHIFSRITGGSVTEIDGLIKANGNASLFLLNPAGIVFGANAQLNLGGSFIATTADSIVFADGAEFSAVDQLNQPLLTVNLPIGLQYGATPGAIIASPPAESGFLGLAVTPGNTLALLGGNILLDGTTLSAGLGKVEIGSVDGEGEINLQPHDLGWQFDYQQVPLGQIELKQRTLIDTRGIGGIVSFHGENIKLSERSGVRNFTRTAQDGGSINLYASESVQLDSSFLATQVGERANESVTISGDGGDILINAKQVSLNNGAAISTGTISNGNGGDLTVNATELIQVSGFQVNDLGRFTPSLLTTSTGGAGAGGSLTINTGKLILQNSGRIEAAIFNTGRRLPVNARESRESTVGAIAIDTNSLLLQEGAAISTNAEGNGDGGNISITTDTLVLLDESKIRANASDGSGGNIIIQTQGLFAAPETIIDASSDFSTDGEVEINTPDADSSFNFVKIEQSPLAAEDLIYTGCSVDSNFADNQFNYIGRGGVPTNPLNQVAIEDTLVDLGNTEQEEDIDKTTDPNDKSKTKSRQSTGDRSIVEATNWLINQNGNVELVAQTHTSSSLQGSACSMNSQPFDSQNN